MRSNIFNFFLFRFSFFFLQENADTFLFCVVLDVCLAFEEEIKFYRETLKWGCKYDKILCEFDVVHSNILSFLCYYW